MALPGVTTVLKDHFYTISRTDIPTGPRVCVLGTRTTADNTSDGSVAVPSYDPYLASNEKNVIAAFGDGSHLHRAYIEMVSAGATQIYLVALPSDTVDADLIDTSTGNRFDQAFEGAETILPDIIVPWGRGSDPTEWDSGATPGDNPPNFGFVADNDATASNSLARRVANKVADITNRTHPCFAVMGIKPYTAGAQNMTASQVSSHLALPNLTDRETMGGAVTDPTQDTFGEYLSIVASEIIPLGYKPSWGYGNGAATYAGQVSTLQSWRASTGKILLNVTGIRYNPTRTQSQALTDLGVVPVALNFDRVPAWVDGVSFARATSDYVRLSTLRIIFDAVQLVRQIAQGYIGEAATLEHRNAFETAITGGLRGMKQQGALLDGNFVASYFPRENKATVDLVLQPAFELRVIEISVSVQL